MWPSLKVFAGKIQFSSSENMVMGGCRDTKKTIKKHGKRNQEVSVPSKWHFLKKITKNTIAKIAVIKGLAIFKIVIFS